MEHWYVYFKLPAAEVAAVAERIRIMQGALAAASGVHGSLIRRVEVGETVTLMEVYERISDPQAFAAQLADASTHAGLAPELIAARRTERFCEL
ncbi:MAG: DUF4936 family protein [Burkholderiaceae bacterium]